MLYGIFYYHSHMNTKKIFEGKTIVQIRLSKYTLSIDFNDNVSILLSDSLILYMNGEKISTWHHKGPSQNLEKLIKIIELQYKEIVFSEEKGLMIDFGDYKLDIPKPDDDYEYLHVMSDTEGVHIY